MNTQNTIQPTGAENTTAAQPMPLPELFDACMDHLINVQGKTERVALDIMSEGAAGTLFADFIAKRRAAQTSAARTVRYNYSLYRVREGVIIEETEARTRVLWTREFFVGKGDVRAGRAFPINVRTWVAKQRLTLVNSTEVA